MTETQDNRTKRCIAWKSPLMWLLSLASVPFWAGFVMLGWKALHLSDKAGNFARAQVWEGAVFALGLAVGITGAAIALAVPSTRCRTLGTASVLLGISCVVLAFVMGWSVENPNASALPFALPSILAFSALVLLLNLVRFEAPADGDSVSEEPPRPLSQP